MTMRSLKGKKASPGVGLGYVHVLDGDRATVAYSKRSSLPFSQEIDRFNACLALSKSQLDAVMEKIVQEFGEDYGYLVEAQLMALEDHHWIEDVRDRIRTGSWSAEHAIVLAFESLCEVFSRVDDVYFKERFGDIRAVEKRLLDNLSAAKSEDPSALDPVILVAKSLSPIELVRFSKVQIRGIVLAEGGAMSHLSIFCRAMGIPCLIGVDREPLGAIDGKRSIVDGDSGEWTIDPSDAVWDRYQRAFFAIAAKKGPVSERVPTGCKTQDGRTIRLMANVDFFDEIQTLRSSGAEGIGLLRTETLFLGKEYPPDEEYQREVYAKILEASPSREVVIRLFDVDANHLEGDYLHTKRSDLNPALGLRGIRFLVKNPSILRDQIRAILRSACAGTVSVLVPMVSSVSQIRHVADLIAFEKDDLRAHGVDHAREVRLGAMIEVPSAALTAPIIAKEVDFLSIGTNDLVQYALGVDRENLAVSDLYDPMHPAVLTLIHAIAKAGKEAGIPVGVCGEMASDPLYVPVLVGLGVDFLSTHPCLIGEVRSALQATSSAKASAWVEKLLLAGTPEETRKLLLEWAIPRPRPTSPKFS